MPTKRDQPNLQRLPPRTELGKQLRKIYHQPPCTDDIDYTTLELRCLAMQTKPSSGFPPSKRS